ncbi:acyltransferase [Neiella marina]|uniref:Acyltransferase n=1 Tax=Neiella marina TaxID=508461 RepID=A0A8J2U7R5_9GAMM|nr:acyltransferase [Neiella marina]GGA84410.1 acyltransferase [Neiella marina]
MLGRIYYLDVLRALAIMLVFTAHTVSSFGKAPDLVPLGFGGSGVDLFFMLSGWLIGSQLFAEQKKFGNIDVKRFWARRWMRTLPAYFFVLSFTLVQLYATKDSVPNPLPFFVFLQNYNHLNYFTVSWSLCVEEQFYLVIAPLLLYLGRLHRHYQTAVLVILLLLPSLFRALGWYTHYEQTHVRWDCCLIGVLLAQCYFQYPTLWQKAKKYATPLLIISVIAYISCFVFRWFPPSPSYSDPSFLLLGVIFAGMVFFAVTTQVHHKPIGYGVVMLISTRSYSMYLLHPEALALMRRVGDDLPFVVYYGIALAITLVISEFLYRWVEIPFINMRSNYSFSQKRVSV